LKEGKFLRSRNQAQNTGKKGSLGNSGDKYRGKEERKQAVTGAGGEGKKYRREVNLGKKNWVEIFN